MFTLLHIGLGVGLEDQCFHFTNTLKRSSRSGQERDKGSSSRSVLLSSDGVPDKDEGPRGRGSNQLPAEIPLNWINGAFITDAMSEERDSTTVGWIEAAIRGGGARALMLSPACLLALSGIVIWFWRRQRRRVVRPSRMGGKRPSGSGLASGGVAPAESGGSLASGAGKAWKGGNGSRDNQDDCDNLKEPAGGRSVEVLAPTFLSIMMAQTE